MINFLLLITRICCTINRDKVCNYCYCYYYSQMYAKFFSYVKSSREGVEKLTVFFFVMKNYKIVVLTFNNYIVKIDEERWSSILEDSLMIWNAFHYTLFYHSGLYRPHIRTGDYMMIVIIFLSSILTWWAFKRSNIQTSAWLSHNNSKNNTNERLYCLSGTCLVYTNN